MESPYVAGFVPLPVTAGDAVRAAEHSTPCEVRHAVAKAALIDGSEVAVALCGARVTVRRGEQIPER